MDMPNTVICAACDEEITNDEPFYTTDDGKYYHADCEEGYAKQ
jgi:hypothetical protein